MGRGSCTAPFPQLWVLINFKLNSVNILCGVPGTAEFRGQYILLILPPWEAFRRSDFTALYPFLNPASSLSTSARSFFRHGPTTAAFKPFAVKNSREVSKRAWGVTAAISRRSSSRVLRYPISSPHP